MTLPTSTAPEGYSRGVVAGALVTTLRAPIVERLVFEGSVGLGYAPGHGDLEKYQHTTFVSASSGLRWRFWGRQSLYGNLFLHTPYYHDTTIRALDRRDLAFDFGWILADGKAGGSGGWELTGVDRDDPEGPGIDLGVQARRGALSPQAPTSPSLKGKFSHVAEQEFLRLGIPQIEPVVIDELLLHLKPLYPAHPQISS